MGFKAAFEETWCLHVPDF